jgi:hypothetical protein
VFLLIFLTILRQNRRLTAFSSHSIQDFCAALSDPDRPTCFPLGAWETNNSEETDLLRSPCDLDLNRAPPLRSIHITLCTPLGWMVGIESSVITVSELTILDLHAV